MFMLIVMIMVLMSIIMIHFKTDNVKEVAVTWGILVFIVTLLAGNFLIGALLGLSAFAVAWLVFTLSNYLEESIFFRLIVLVIGMLAMLKLPILIVDIIFYLFG